MPHISLSNLTIAYGNQKVLQNITVDIPNNQITTIIGPSGCGKTTLLKSLNRLVDLYEEINVQGEVRIDGVNIYDPKADVLALRKKVGFLSQKPYPLPMSIYDNVTFGPRIHRIDGNQIRDQIHELEKHVTIDPLTAKNNRRVKEAGRNQEMGLLVESYLRLAGLWDEVYDRLD